MKTLVNNMLVCDCGNTSFTVLFVEAHVHVRCLDCNQIYCDGGMNVAEPWNLEKGCDTVPQSSPKAESSL